MILQANLLELLSGNENEATNLVIALKSNFQLESKSCLLREIIIRVFGYEYIGMIVFLNNLKLREEIQEIFI